MWIYNNKEIDEDDISDKAIGFIYVILNKNNGKKYIGKKLLTKAAYKTVNGKRKKYRKDSDWQNYWSSSEELINVIKREGEENFTREILFFCNSLSELNYSEEKLQFCLEVLESEKWYNGNIRAKIFKRNILCKVKDMKDIIERLKI